MKYSKLLFLAPLCLAGSLPSISFADASSATACAIDSFNEKVNSYFNRATEAVCGQLDTEPTLDQNPWKYENKLADCGDSLFQLPGLPDYNGIGFDVDASACEAAKLVIGDTVNEWTQKYDDAVNSGMEAIDPINKDYNVDLNDAVNDIITEGN